MTFIKTLYINNFFFYLLIGIVMLFVCAFIFPFLYEATWYLFLIIMGFFGMDILILFLAKTGVEGARITPEKLSNGDENEINLSIRNYYTFPILVQIIDEIPVQFQIRNFEIRKKKSKLLRKPESIISCARQHVENIILAI